MPLKRCQENNRPGWKWGDSGKCYVYNPESKTSETVAKKKAVDQGIAIGEYVREAMERLQTVYKKLRRK